MLYIPKYYWKILRTSLQATWKKFVPDKGNLVRSILITAIVWILLVFVESPLTDKITEASALAIAVVVTFALQAIVDLFVTPAKIDRDQTRLLDGQALKLNLNKARTKLQNIMIKHANALRNIQTEFEIGAIGFIDFEHKSNEILKELKVEFDNHPKKELLDYKLNDFSSSSFSEGIIWSKARKITKHLGLDREVANKVASLYVYKDNLDEIIDSIRVYV